MAKRSRELAHARLPEASVEPLFRPGWHPLTGERERGRARAGQTHGGGQAGYPAAQDQDVEGSRRGPAGHAGSDSVSSASRRADASSITRLRPSTCTTRGT